MGLICSPEQLRVDEGDYVLQDFVGRADQEVGPEGFDEGAQEGRLVRAALLAGQQHLHLLSAALSSSSCCSSYVVGGGWRRPGVDGLTGQVLVTEGTKSSEDGELSETTDFQDFSRAWQRLIITSKSIYNLL